MKGILTFVFRLGNRIHYILIFLSIVIGMILLQDENILETFMPRAACMYRNPKLVAIHFYSDLAIFASYTIMGGALFYWYHKLKKKSIPFKGLLWMFGGFIFLCGLTHGMGAINIYVTYYWVDGFFKVATAIFSAGVAVTIINSTKLVLTMKSPEEYQNLADRLKSMQETYQELKKRLDG